MGVLDRLFGAKRARSASADGTDLPGDPTKLPGLGTSPVRPVAEADATPDIAAVYEGAKQGLKLPFVPNIVATLANSPQALSGTMGLLGPLYLNTTLPRPVVSMMLYSIAAALECRYCGSIQKMSCRMAGVDEDTLAALCADLHGLTPERVQAVVAFAVKAARNPKSLAAEDFAGLRRHGFGDSEIVEIVALAGMAAYLNIIADGLKVDVDDMVRQGLAA